MLLKINAVKNKISTPVSTGDRTYQYPKFFIFSVPIIAIKAVAPPGGCKVFVICIKTIDKETANGADKYIVLGSK